MIRFALILACLTPAPARAQDNPSVSVKTLKKNGFSYDKKKGYWIDKKGTVGDKGEELSQQTIADLLIDALADQAAKKRTGPMRVGYAEQAKIEQAITRSVQNDLVLLFLNAPKKRRAEFSVLPLNDPPEFRGWEDPRDVKVIRFLQDGAGFDGAKASGT